MTSRTSTAIGEALAGRLKGPRAMLAFVGPAVIASIAYMDPGNYATNIGAGAGYGYALIWVVVLANLVAMLFQALSAKLGIVTGRNLAELSRDHFPFPVVIAMWIVSEIAAMATDLAEFLGGAIGLSLLFGTSLLTGMAITAVVTYALDVRPRRLPADGTDHRRPRRHHRRQLPDRDGDRSGRLARRRRRRHSCAAGRRCPDAGRRHHRRHRHAARRLPALRPHPAPGAGPQRGRAEEGAGSSPISKWWRPSLSPASSTSPW